MTNEELLLLMDDFINEYGQFYEFLDYIGGKGYSEIEYNMLIESIEK